MAHFRTDSASQVRWSREIEHQGAGASPGRDHVIHSVRKLPPFGGARAAVVTVSRTVVPAISRRHAWKGTWTEAFL